MFGAVLALLALPVALLGQHSFSLGAGLGVGLTLALVLRVAKRPEEGAYALIALAPLTDMGQVVPGSGVRISYVVLAAALAGWGFALLRRREAPPKMHWLVWALAAPAVAGFVTSPFSLDPGRSALYSARLLALWAAAVFVAAQMRDADRVRGALGTLVATGVALSSVALLQLALPFAGIGRTYAPVMGDALGAVRPAATFMDPNFLGGLLSVCALAAAAMAAAAFVRGDRLAWGIGAIACAFGMALTVSRSAWVGLVAGAVAVVVSAPRERRLGVGVALAGFALAALVAVPGTAARFAGGADGSVATRVALLEGEARIALERPLTGTGLAMLGRAYAEAGGGAATGRVTDPHQVPLAVVAQTGVAGLFAGIAVLAGLVSAWSARRRRGWRAEDSAVACALVALAAQSLFQYYAYFEPLWLAMALAAAAASRE